MADPVYDLFISYRRENGAAEARLLRERLIQEGWRVFLDVADLKKGYFDEALLRYIGNSPNFLVCSRRVPSSGACMNRIG